MGDGIGRYRGTESKLAQWLRRRPKRTAADDENDREKLLLAVAAAGLPLAPAAYPVGYSCSCERIGCPTPARHPVSFAWQTQSTTDRGQIERWARNEPEANFITATRGTPEDVVEWWPCELDCHPETMDEHPGLRWHCRGSYVLVPPAALPGDQAVTWIRGMEHPLPDPLTLLETLTDACATYAGTSPQTPAAVAWPLGR